MMFIYFSLNQVEIAGYLACCVNFTFTFLGVWEISSLLACSCENLKPKASKAHNAANILKQALLLRLELVLFWPKLYRYTILDGSARAFLFDRMSHHHHRRRNTSR